jgi:hypothetical protein
MAFTSYDPSVHSHANLLSALVGSGVGLNVDSQSMKVSYGRAQTFSFASGTSALETSSLSFYNGSLSALNIGSGLLLSTGSAVPPLKNTMSDYTGIFKAATANTQVDAQMQSVVNSAFNLAGKITESTSVEFKFEITDKNVKGIRFELVFGSEEYPEYQDSSFVDIAAVFVNNINYALFNQQEKQPLSVLTRNIESGNFRDNQNGSLNIEYNGVSNVLTVVAPVVQGTNTIKIGVADTGDEDLDSALFVSGIRAVDFAGFGLAPVIEVGKDNAGTGVVNQLADTAGNQVYSFAKNSKGIVTFGPKSATGGNAGGGDDVVLGGGGFVTVKFDMPLKDIASYELLNNGISVQTPNGSKVLNEIARIALQDALFAMDTQKGNNTWNAYALLKAGFGQTPSTSLLSQWVKVADQNNDQASLANKIINHYAPGIASKDFVQYLYKTLVGQQPTESEVNHWSNQIGQGKTFNTQGDLLSYAANQEDFNNMAAITGQPQQLDLLQFANSL